jgi:hypothetical protein
MKESSKNIIPFKTYGESNMMFFLGLGSMIIVEFLFFLAAIFGPELYINLIFSALFILMLAYFKKAIWTVDFTTDEIIITHIFGNKKLIKYNQIRKFYKNQEHIILPLYVYVIKYQNENNGRLKKLTFWTKTMDQEKFKKELIELKQRA